MSDISLNRATTPSWLSHLLLVLAIVWVLTFAGKGALYQSALYLLPLLVLLAVLVRRLRLPWRLSTPVMVFMSLLVLPILIGDLHLWRQSQGDYRGFEVVWRLLVFPACLLTVALASERLQRWLMPAFLCSCGIHFVLALLTEVTGNGEWQGRFHGVIFNPNQFGLLMGVGVLCSLPYAIRGVRLGQLLVAASLAGCVLSGSRAAVVATALGGVVWLWRSQSLRDGWRILGYLLLGALLFVLLSLAAVVAGGADLSEFKRYLTPTESPVRFQIWAHYWQLWQNHWWLGTGIGESTQPVFGGKHYYPHNQYLEILAISGVVGLLSFLSAMGLLIYRLLLLPAQQSALPLSLMVVMAVFCFFNSSFYFSEVVQGVVALMVVYVAKGEGGRMAPLYSTPRKAP